MPLVSLLGLPCPALPEPEVGHSVWHSLTLQSLTSLSKEETFFFLSRRDQCFSKAKTPVCCSRMPNCTEVRRKLCKTPGCPISFDRRSLLNHFFSTSAASCPCYFFFFLIPVLLAQGSQSFLNNQRLRHYPNRVPFLGGGEEILGGRCLAFFASGPKMADAQTPFCASLLCFGVQNPSLVFNQRQLAEAIFADICVCTSV